MEFDRWCSRDVERKDCIGGQRSEVFNRIVPNGKTVVILIIQKRLLFKLVLDSGRGRQICDDQDDGTFRSECVHPSLAEDDHRFLP
jgi:hypothetical protein